MYRTDTCTIQSVRWQCVLVALLGLCYCCCFWCCIQYSQYLRLNQPMCRFNKSRNAHNKKNNQPSSQYDILNRKTPYISQNILNVEYKNVMYRGITAERQRIALVIFFLFISCFALWSWPTVVFSIIIDDDSPATWCAEFTVPTVRRRISP